MITLRQRIFPWHLVVSLHRTGPAVRPIQRVRKPSLIHRHRRSLRSAPFGYPRDALESAVLPSRLGEGSDASSLSQTVLTWLDRSSNSLAIVLYALAATTTLALGLVDRHRARESGQRLWPTFWFATGGLLLVMAAGRAGNVSHLLTDIGRAQARSDGWYDVRRWLQAGVIGAVAAVWAATVALAVWRTTERRRRYLPTAIVVFTLVCYVGVRLISLHQVDALLHHRGVRGLADGAVVEVGLLLSIIVLSAWQSPRANNARVQHVEPGASSPIRG